MTATQALLARRAAAVAGARAAGPRRSAPAWVTTGIHVGSSWIPARAQALVTKDEVLQVRAQRPSAIRRLAASQIQKARDLFERVSDGAWHHVISDYVHWSPFKTLIEDAQTHLDRGDRELTEADQKEKYVAAWLAGQVAVERIAHEAKLNESDWAAYIDPVTELVQEVAGAVKQVTADVTSGLESAVKFAAVGAAVWVGLKFFGQRRG